MNVCLLSRRSPGRSFSVQRVPIGSYAELIADSSKPSLLVDRQTIEQRFGIIKLLYKQTVPRVYITGPLSKS